MTDRDEGLPLGTRHCDRRARIITALTLFELKCPSELIERIGMSPKSSENTGKLLMISTRLVMVGIGVRNGLFVSFGRIRQPLLAPESQGLSRQMWRAVNVHDFSLLRSQTSGASYPLTASISSWSC